MAENLDRFTKRARRVLTTAGDEARRLNHRFIGTEHILLGIVSEEGGVAMRVLQELATSVLKGVLLVFVYRPEYSPPWSDTSSLRVIELGPLDSNSSELLFRSCSQSTKEDVSRIVERGGGNPLFIEELAAHQTTVSQAEHSNRTVASAIPTNLSGLLMQRVDSLSLKSKALLKTASVVGRRFQVDLVTRPGAERDLALKELVNSSLLIEEGRAGQFRF